MDDLRGWADIGRMILEFWQAGYGGVAILILGLVGLWILHRACQKRYADCETRSRDLTYALWHWFKGDEDRAKALTDKIMSEHYGGGP